MNTEPARHAEYVAPCAVCRTTMNVRPGPVPLCPICWVDFVIPQMFRGTE